MQKVILIWAVLIGAYLILTRSGGFAQALGSFGTFITGTTKALQGR